MSWQYQNPSLWNALRGAEGIPLREELTSLLHGASPIPGIGRWGLLRRLIRDSSNQPTLCTCRELSSKANPTFNVCDRCLNEGYKWTEEYILFHKKSGVHGSREMHRLSSIKPIGEVYTPKDVFYLEYSTLPTILDSIIEIALDQEGRVITPVARKSFHLIKAVEEFRADSGRIEYFQCSCAEVTTSFFGQPLAQRNPATGRQP